jgi:DNA-binding phage protein
MQEKFNIDALVEELDKEFAAEVEVPQASPEEQDTEEVNEAPVEEVEEEADEEESEEQEVEEEVTDEENVEAVVSEDLHKRNEAFKSLREERDKLAASDKFLSELAIQYGLTKEQLMERFTKQQQEKAAQEQGIEPEQYRKMIELENKVQQIEEDKRREVFNIRAEAFANYYELNNDDLELVFEEAGRLGLDVTKDPKLLEVVYRNMTYEDALEKGRQQQLETSKKRTKTSTGKTGTQGTQVDTQQQWDAEIDKVLKDNYIIK